MGEPDLASSESDNLVAVPTEASLVFAVFIPCDVLSSPEPRFDRYYHGDNRSFSYDLAMTESRAALSVTLSPERPTVVTKHIGETRSYTYEQLSSGPDADSCYALKRDSGKDPVPANRATASDSDVRAKVTWMKDDYGRPFAEVKLGIHATNPVAYGAPPVDGDIKVYVGFDKVAGGWTPINYWAIGSHDYYPAFELYLNETPIYLFDGVAQGNGSMSMFTTISGQQSVEIPAHGL